MQWKENIPLRPFTSFGVEAAARYFAEFDSLSALQEILADDRINGQRQLVLGGGSNILMLGDFDGVVLKNECRGMELLRMDDDHAYVRVGAGENWHSFVQYCIEQGWGGAENLSLIPGNVGASPMQNIGAYGVEIKDIFHELEAWHIGEKTLLKFGLEDCEFGYRESVFKKKYRNQVVILNVTYQLNLKPVLNTNYGAIEQELERMGVKHWDIRSVSRAVINIRSSKLPDPKQIGNAGSFFKNPVVSTPEWERLKTEFPAILGYPASGGMKLAAGWLIEQSGWKGFRRGDAGCHEKQALVLVNYGRATGKEIYQLSEDILLSVQAKFGVELEREVNMIV